MLHLEDRSRVCSLLVDTLATADIFRIETLRWLQRMYLELKRCAGYSRCTENWNIALVAADVLRFGTLRWLQRMYWRLEHCAGCSGCYALVAADVRRRGRV